MKYSGVSVMRIADTTFKRIFNILPHILKVMQCNIGNRTEVSNGRSPTKLTGCNLSSRYEEKFEILSIIRVPPSEIIE